MSDEEKRDTCKHCGRRLECWDSRTACGDQFSCGYRAAMLEAAGEARKVAEDRAKTSERFGREGERDYEMRHDGEREALIDMAAWCEGKVGT